MSWNVKAPRSGDANRLRKHPVAETPESPIRLNHALTKYGLGKSTIYRKFEDGSLTRYKFGGATFIDEREIIENMTPATAA